MVVDTSNSVPGTVSPIVSTAMSQVFEVYSAKDFVSLIRDIKYSAEFALTLLHSQECQPVHLSRMLSGGRALIFQQRRESRAKHQRNPTRKIAEMSINGRDDYDIYWGKD